MSKFNKIKSYIDIHTMMASFNKSKWCLLCQEMGKMSTTPRTPSYTEYEYLCNWTSKFLVSKRKFLSQN